MSRHLAAEDWALLVVLILGMAGWIADTVLTSLSIGKRPSQSPKGRTEAL